jgi:hypothetical protein
VLVLMNVRRSITGYLVRLGRTAECEPERLRRLQDVDRKLVELRGVEPLTPRLPALCSPN